MSIFQAKFTQLQNNSAALAVDLRVQAESAFQRWIIGRTDLWIQVMLAALSAFLHFWHLDLPNTFVFDEVYFPVYAQNYLQQTPFFDAHPPLGKYLIAAGIRFFGFNPLGYRVMDALFGIGVVLLIFRLGRLLFDSRRVAVLAGLFACLDGLLLVESRAGLINIFAVFFSLAAYYLFLKGGREEVEKPRWVYLAGSGVCIGAAAAVKWIGIAGLGVILFLYALARLKYRRPQLPNPLAEKTSLRIIGQFRPRTLVLFCIIVPALIYSVTFIPHLRQNPQFPLIELHKQMFGYHAHLQEGHTYASPWWSWPLLLRPVSYYWQLDESTQQVSTILNLGNPALWWLAIPATFFAMWIAVFRREFGAQFALLAITFHYLPFAIISRATFNYHFMGALPFTILLLAFTLNRLWGAGGWRRELAAVGVAAIVACGIYFLPLWIGLPVPTGAFYQRMWLASWI